MKGLAPPELIWCIGPFSDTTPADRVPGPAPIYKQPRKVDLMAELKADQKATITLRGRDEMGNPTDAGGIDVVFAVDDESIVALTDNGDNSCVVAAIGPLGPTVVTAEGTRTSDGKPFSGAVAINVVAGDTESIELVVGEPEEVTPDA